MRKRFTASEWVAREAAIEESSVVYVRVDPSHPDVSHSRVNSGNQVDLFCLDIE
ncbi:hypothetical protein SAMN05444166_0468 [Singulisphaera sp. GP187]|nr:hypothetical protein SAMN05444166_0468 [Singulisphaera sp. GP187]